MGLFSDIWNQAKTAKLEEERYKFEARIYEELDRMRESLLREGVFANTSAKPQSAPNMHSQPSSGPSGQAASSGNKSVPFSDDSDRDAWPAAGQLIMPDQLVTFKLAADGSIQAYLACANNAELPAHSVCVSASSFGGRRKLKCNRVAGTTKQMRIRLATSGVPAVGTEMRLSALVPGAVTDNPLESGDREFDQRIGTFVQLATNSQKKVQLTVGIIDVDFSPPASLPAAA